ncbi:hypothetical protein OEZ86_002425 [Tetradesmus obliquus]|nr:hypothetical protein OEZ86_002425 [Tetradesmus obliquus]
MTWSKSVLADVGEAEAVIDDLFKCCDKDSNGVLCFAEVAALFKQLSPEQSSESAANAAVEALLLVDTDASRQLDRAEFGKLLGKVSDVAGTPLLEAAHKLHDSIQQQQPASQHHPSAAGASSQTPASKLEYNAPSPGHPSPPPPAAAAAAAADMGSSKAAEAADDDSKLLTLFALWDKTGDGRVSLQELCQGLAKFQPVKSKQDVLSLLRESASALALHDSNGDRQLDCTEFAAFMARFMHAAGFALAEVLDELLLLAATKPDSKKLARVLDDAQPQIEQLLSSKE